MRARRNNLKWHDKQIVHFEFNDTATQKVCIAERFNDCRAERCPAPHGLMRSLRWWIFVLWAAMASPVWSAPPTISAIPNQAVPQGRSPVEIVFMVNDPDTPVNELVVTATSANDVLVPNHPGALALAGSGASRTIQVIPTATHSGVADITITVSDGTDRARSDFKVTVEPMFTSPQLRFIATERFEPEELRLRFVDTGTGSTNYVLEYLPAFALGVVWSNAVGAVILPLGNGVYQANLPHPPSDTGFFRVSGLRSLVAGFSSRGLTVHEGAGTVNLVIVLNGPFVGTIRYSVEGTAGAGDFVALSGEVAVNGTTAVIPLTLLDNLAIGQLKYLTLRLEPGAGYRLGATHQSTVTIEENDAEWQGNVQTASGTLGFVLRMLQSGGGVQAALTNGGFGFFPTTNLPAQVFFGENAFAATVAHIPIPAGSTLLNSAMTMTLHLTAANGQTNETVSSTEVQGQAELILQIPDKPHLNSTNRGSFALLKPPVQPSTNEVELVTAP